MATVLDKQLAEGRLLAMLPQHKLKVDKARDDIRSFIRRTVGQCYNSLSWGKQSIVLAHMIFSVDQSIKNVFWGGEYMELISDFAATRDKFLSKWPLDYIGYDAGDTELKENGVKFLIDHDMFGVFMGLAKCESKARKRTLEAANFRNVFSYANRKMRCCPLADWSDMDIAAYISVHNIPLLSTYRKYGITARTSAGVTPGSHAEKGMDILSSESQARINKIFRC